MLLDAVAKSLLAAERHVLAARVLALNTSSGTVYAVSGWRQAGSVAPGPPQADTEGLSVGSRPDRTTLPWMPESLSVLTPTRFMEPQPELSEHAGRWTVPYYACAVRRWIMSYTADITPNSSRLQPG